MKRKIFIFILTFFSYHNISAQINTDRVLIIGRNALYYEDYVLAIQYFNQVIISKPYLAEPYFYRAIAKYYLDDYRGAEMDCDEAIKRNPYMIRVYQLRGETRQRQNLFDGALEDYNFVLRNNPRDLFSGINSSLIYLEQDKKDDALNQINEVVSFSPNNPQVYLVKGSIELAKGDTISTMSNFNKAIDLDKYSSRAYGMRGMLYYMQGINDSAIVDMDHAIELEPNVYDFYINRGLVRYAINDFRGAMKDYDYVIEKEPDNILAHFNRGLLRSQVGDNNNAISDFNFVLAQQPTNYMALYNRAILNNEVGNYTQAIEDMNRIIEKYPDKISVYNARGTFYRNKKDEEKATKDFKYAAYLEQKALKDINSQVDKNYQVKYKKEDDGDIDKFQLLVMSDDNNIKESKYKNEKRGDIQNRTVNIDPEGMFVLSYYSKVDEYNNNVYFNKEIENVNKLRVLPKLIRLTNDELSLNQERIDEHFESMNTFSDHLSNDPNNKYFYFGRAMDHILVQDYLNAGIDLQKSLDIDNNFLLALFELAVVKTKEIETLKYDMEQKTQPEVIYSAPATISTAKSKNTVVTPVQKPVDVSNNTVDRQKQNFEMIIKIYDKLVDLYPSFAYSYYNRGLLRYEQGDYQAAMNDFSEAISMNDKFPEAYFNRALCYLQLKMNDKGLQDMRKAGEGGIIEAYPIIKRMTE